MANAGSNFRKAALVGAVVPLSARRNRVYLAICALPLLLVLALSTTLSCTRDALPRQLPETPRELRSYPIRKNHRVTYEHPQERWSISHPAEWEVARAFAREGYSSTDITSSDYGWELSLVREAVTEWHATDWPESYQQARGRRDYDSYGAASGHLASAAEWDVDKPVREVVFLKGNDVTIEGHAAYLMEYLWIPRDQNQGQETSWVLGLFQVVGRDKFEVTLKGPPARMLSARDEMRDIVLSFRPAPNTPPPPALPTALCAPAEAIVTSAVRGESRPNSYQGVLRSVTVTVIGTVTNTCNRSLDFNLIGVVYDDSGRILGTSGESWQYFSNGPERDFVRRPSVVLHLAPGWHEQVRFDVWLSPATFDRATSVAIVVLPP